MKISHPHFLKQTRTFGERSCFALSGLLLIALLLSAPTIYSQQPQPPKTMRLGSIEITGLQKVTKEQAVAISGLEIGQQISVEMLDAAAQRLASSGLFTNLSYRLRGSKDQAIVTFEVEELKGKGVPVVFDNFVWFSNEELTSAIRREVPNFNGTAPESDSIVGAITRALQQLLTEKNIQGQVDYKPSADLAGGNVKHVFSVKGANTKICAVRFPGTANVQESELVKHSKELMGSEYSQEFVSAFAVANLIPVYRERGYLQARFSTPTARLGMEASESCKDEVVITLPVNEGVAYLWDKAEWSGNASYTAQELEASLAMKSGELANGLKIDAGVEAVQKNYGKKGFLRARVATEPIFDDANRRVAYRLSLTEGPQYRMGTLTITGLSDIDTLSLKHRWKLREQRDVYDDSYLEEFNKKDVREVLERALREGRLSPGTRLGSKGSIKPNNQTLTVDVELNFKSAASPTATVRSGIK
jgi:outer membrane protein insertion porin family